MYSFAFSVVNTGEGEGLSSSPSPTGMFKYSIRGSANFDTASFTSALSSSTTLQDGLEEMLEFPPLLAFLSLTIASTSMSKLSDDSSARAVRLTRKTPGTSGPRQFRT